MKKLILIFSFLLAMVGSGRTWAQACDPPFETITTLRAPQIGIPTVWDAKFVQQNSMVQLMSGIPLEGGTVFAMGRTLATDDFSPKELVFAEINRRGRVLNEVKYPARDGETPVKLIGSGGGYTALTNIRGGTNKGRRWVRLSWYAKDGKYRHDKVLQDDLYEYDGIGLLPAVDDNGFIAVVHALKHDGETDQYGLLVRFSQDGREMWRRAYRPGIPNQIMGLEKADDKSYIATGRILMDDGRMAAWVMNLGYDGTVLWQRTYPRGAFSMLNRSAFSSEMTADGKGYFLLGRTTPLDGGPDAVWVMAITGLGDPLWQRYYRRPDFSLEPFGLLNAGDGRVILAVNAKPAGGTDGRAHVRMLVLSLEGNIVQDESYVDGIEAIAHEMTPGWNGERVVTATIQSDDKPVGADLTGGSAGTEESSSDVMGPPLPPAMEKKSSGPVQEGWIFVATALDPYDNPCAQKSPVPQLQP